MIKIHATKKLFAKLPVDAQGFLPQAKNSSILTPQMECDESLLSGWHANLITLQRRNCVLFTHDASRFALFIPCLKKADLAQLNWHFQDVLMNTLLKLDASQQQLDTAASLLQPLCFDTDCNRSVQGTMNQMKGDVGHMLWFDGASVQELSPYRTSVWLSDRPCMIKTAKDCIWPLKKMGELLGGGELLSPRAMARGQELAESQIVNQPIASNNVVQLKDYRNDG